MFEDDNNNNEFEKIQINVFNAIESMKGSDTQLLETYLISLYSLLPNNPDPEPSWQQIGNWLIEALSITSPIDFNPAWLEYIAPPEEETGTPWEEFEHTILFQIADLNRMRGGALENELRYFGEESPTGNSWYNFDPDSYLKCALFGISAHRKKDRVFPSGWRSFANFLELGRLYE